MFSLSTLPPLYLYTCRAHSLSVSTCLNNNNFADINQNSQFDLMGAIAIGYEGINSYRMRMHKISSHYE